VETWTETQLQLQAQTLQKFQAERNYFQLPELMVLDQAAERMACLRVEQSAAGHNSAGFGTTENT
jgi:hypothetical protein